MKRTASAVFALVAAAVSPLSIADDISFVDTGQALGSTEGFSVDAQLGDIDGDGDIDALVTSVGEDFAMQTWINDGSAVFTLGQTFGLGNRDEFVLGDFDSDGDLDAFVTSNGLKEVWKNDGGGTFSLSSSFTTGEIQVREVIAGDLDLDGDLDVFSSGRNIEVFLNDGNAGFTELQQLEFGFSSWSALGDVDGDGDLDAYLTCAGQCNEQLLLNDGSGLFTTSTQVFPNGTNLVAIAQFDSSTGVDLVLASDNHVKLMSNDGGGIFTTTNDAFIGFVPRLDIAIGDLDGDDDVDVFTAGGSSIAFFSNDGEGLFAKVQEDAIPGFGSAALADLDGDSDLDAFVALWVAGNQVWLNESVIEPDSDGDDIPDSSDNCPDMENFDQTNSDNDALGDACDDDDDNDGLSDDRETSLGTNPLVADTDGDGSDDAVDNCPVAANADQADLDNDLVGDICDEDLDGDSVGNDLDLCPATLIPENTPVVNLRRNRFALTGNGAAPATFESTSRRVFTTEDTGGCSCEQILEQPGFGGARQAEYGCVAATLIRWSRQVP
ncbi:FG-GAP-like repeat-containing protein [Granulosicoccus sp. 3-233]|uniref:FG-GAP-like repeat-containing protein n=1 Tax=Granulosicoccus sp. 3-233 TaxID=3417969 RepID=UPI003D326849